MNSTIKLIFKFLIILISLVSIGCKTEEQRLIEKYQNMKPDLQLGNGCIPSNSF